MAMKRAPIHLAAKIGLLGGLLASTALPSFAASFGLREQSAAGQGMSFAGVAAGGGGLASMFWNPSTMTDYPGITSTFVGTTIAPGGSIKPNPVSPTAIFGQSNTNTVLSGFAPSGYSAYQFNDQLWLGVSTNAPWGLQSKPGFNWAAQVYGRSAKVFSFDVTPSAAYKINDWISVGVGLQIMYFKARLSQALGILPNTPSAILVGDDTSVGYTAGVTLKPFAGTEIGVGYRSSVHESLGGSLTTPAGATPTNFNINLPEEATIGFRQVINPEWTVLGGFEWVNWRRLNIVPVTSGGLPVTDLPFAYRKDGYDVSLGVEYAWNPALTLRTGIAFERTPIDFKNREVLLPDNNRIWASLGATYHYSSKMTFDLGYSHGFLPKGRIAIVPGNPTFAGVGLPFVGTVKDGRFDIVSASVTYRWDDPTQTIPVQPIIRKP